MKISKISNCGIARFTLYVKDIIYNFILNARIFLKARGNVIILYPRDAQERVPYKNINKKRAAFLPPFLKIQFFVLLNYHAYPKLSPGLNPTPPKPDAFTPLISTELPML